MREGFLLDPDIAYLNHGGFGACPVAVFQEYQRWQVELERGPTGFLTRRVEKWVGDRLDRSGILGEARTDLARFVGARPEDLVFVRNATSGLNAVIRSLRLRREEEALTTSHEYGAILRTWEFVGANLVLCSSDTLIERIGPRTSAGLHGMERPRSLV